MVFIPGNESLTLFLFKTKYRIVDDFVKGRISDKKLKYKYQAYVKGRLIETVLHAVVLHIEKSYKRKATTLGVFRYIGVALNNVNTGISLS